MTPAERRAVLEADPAGTVDVALAQVAEARRQARVAHRWLLVVVLLQAFTVTAMIATDAIGIAVVIR